MIPVGDDLRTLGSVEPRMEWVPTEGQRTEPIGRSRDDLFFSKLSIVRSFGAVRQMRC